MEMVNQLLTSFFILKNIKLQKSLVTNPEVPKLIVNYKCTQHNNIKMDLKNCVMEQTKYHWQWIHFSGEMSGSIKHGSSAFVSFSLGWRS